jgi:hypothetical protein
MTDVQIFWILYGICLGIPLVITLVEAVVTSVVPTWRDALICLGMGVIPVLNIAFTFMILYVTAKTLCEAMNWDWLDKPIVDWRKN